VIEGDICLGISNCSNPLVKHIKYEIFFRIFTVEAYFHVGKLMSYLDWTLVGQENVLVACAKTFIIMCQSASTKYELFLLHGP
jgi:hypothetical protein